MAAYLLFLSGNGQRPIKFLRVVVDAFAKLITFDKYMGSTQLQDQKHINYAKFLAVFFFNEVAFVRISAKRLSAVKIEKLELPIILFRYIPIPIIA